jgi:hypothetical protein
VANAQNPYFVALDDKQRSSDSTAFAEQHLTDFSVNVPSTDTALPVRAERAVEI